MKTRRIVLILCFGAVCASAQLGGLLKKAPSSKTGTDTAAVMAQGQDLLAYVTIATDYGVEAVDAITSVFPPEKVQKIKDLAAKYNELKAKRGDQNIDAESVQVASQIAAEMAKLDSEWQIHLKEKSAAVRSADARLALVILADGLAATKAPETAKAMQSAAQDLKSDPTQVSKMNRLLSMAMVLATVGKEAPQQVNSFRTVRGITKKIAEAEKIQLAADPSPDSVKDTTALKMKVTSLSGS
jgi:hypothetical protein